MKSFLVWIYLVAFVLGQTPGCGSSSPYTLGVSRNGSLVAINRTFVIYVPSGYTSNANFPLILAFHGGFGSGTQAQSSFKFNPISEPSNFIVVYPNGLSATWNAGGCCNPSAIKNVDDVGFVSTLIDSLGDQLCLDKTRIYSTGMSNGALMTHRLGCQLSDKIAAIAPNAGTLAFPACSPSRPVPILHLHGTADKNVPYEGGLGCGASNYNFTSVPDSMTSWINFNCPSGTSFVNGPATSVQVQVANCTTWTNCTANTTFCFIKDNGHSWPQLPGSNPAGIISGCNSTIAPFSGSQHIWEFFQQHQLPVLTPTPGTTPTPGVTPTETPSPTPGTSTTPTPGITSILIGAIVVAYIYAF